MSRLRSSFACLRAAARAHRVYVCAGLVERVGERVFNSAVLVAPNGDILVHHRKLNELKIAHACYAQGDRLSVAHTPLGTIEQAEALLVAEVRLVRRPARGDGWDSLWRARDARSETR